VVTYAPSFATFLGWLENTVLNAGWQIAIVPGDGCFSAVWLARGITVRLTCTSVLHDDVKCDRRAYEVVAALRRVYGQPPLLELD
jgi:hypothetical protein